MGFQEPFCCAVGPRSPARAEAEMAEMEKPWQDWGNSQKWENGAGHSRQHTVNFSAWADATALPISPDLS